MDASAIKSAMIAIINNRESISKYSMEQLRSIIDYAGVEYYNSTSLTSHVTLPDPIYDFIRDTYEKKQRQLKLNIGALKNYTSTIKPLEPLYYVPSIVVGCYPYMLVVA